MAIPDFDAYRDSFDRIGLERDEAGILTVTLRHDDGGPLLWGLKTYEELHHALHLIAADQGNRIVILTGSGDAFIADAEFPDEDEGPFTPQSFDAWYRFGQRLAYSLLDVDVPMVAAINGPVRIHTDVPLLCDVVLASDTTEFFDKGHVPSGIVPGDGAQVIWQELLGPVRASYYLFMKRTLGAKEALELGVVNEVLPAERLLGRAREVAAELNQLPELTRRYTRATLNARRRSTYRRVGWAGMAAEGLSAVDAFAAPPNG
jgi:enoyl-CoA hydratase/carnithine racemase